MISIIIPVYNGEKYIEKLIENFRHQTISCGSDIELVFIDDGSSDKSAEIIGAHVNRENFTVSVYGQKNAGVSSARNFGIKKAQGEYITFVDVDDAVTEDYIETLTSNISQGGFDVLVFQSIRVKVGEPFDSGFDGVAEAVAVGKTDMLIRMIGNPTKLGVCNLLMKSEFVRANELQFPVGYKYYEDYDFLYRAFGKSEKTKITEKPLYFYILRENSAMQKFIPDRITCLELMRNLVAFFKDNAPDFYGTFKKWGVSRIYWSVLWQAALAFKNYDDFKLFAKATGARAFLSSLTDFPDKKVCISSKLYSISPRAYFWAVNMTGAGHSKVRQADIKTFETAIGAKRILVYGMTDNKGGIESYIMNVYRNIDKSRLIFDFVIDFPDMSYADEVAANGSFVYKIPPKSKNPIGHLARFFMLLKKHPEYGSVYFNVLNAGAAYSMVVPWILRRKIIVHCHNNSDDNMRLHKLFRPFVNRFAYKRLACSRLAAEYMFDNSDKAIIVNNAIDIKPFAYNADTATRLRNELGINRKNVAIHVGRMAPQKNPFFLLDIINEMRKINPDTVLLYAGAGPLETDVKKYTEDIGISDNVIFLGMRC
ncbi:MAG: glycosyltransferase, partial [Clostridiales bacterium]|nr:glycosyltransferase [Clostridiales bacterium]